MLVSPKILSRFWEEDMGFGKKFLHKGSMVLKRIGNHKGQKVRLNKFKHNFWKKPVHLDYLFDVKQIEFLLAYQI